MISISSLKRFVGPIVNRIQMMLGKALLSSLDDSTKIQLIKVSSLEGEVIDGIERLQQYGFSSVPLANESEVMMASISGNRDHTVAINVDSSKYRPTGKDPGVVTVYHKSGSNIEIIDDGTIVLSPSNGVIKFAGDLEISGDVLAEGEVSALSGSPGTKVSLSTHIHPTPVGPTSPPTPGT